MSKQKQIQEYERKQLIDELSKMPPMVIATAYLHALNYTMYGIDVTEKWLTATQQAAALDRAYHKGYSDALEQRWIPVSEELPKENGKYLVTVDEVPFGMPSFTFVCACLYSNGWHLPPAEVIGKRRVVAWQLLPEPYKENEK